MTALDSNLPAVHAMIDRDGRLIEADPRLNDLNIRAGGAIGAPLAIPQLATLARLAQRLGILVSRGIAAADGDDDIDMWVRAEPDPVTAHVRLTISGWRVRQAWLSPAPPTQRDHDFVLSGAAAHWETDAGLRLTHLSVVNGRHCGVEAAPLLGQPLTRLFAFTGSDDGILPVLEALATRNSFQNQPASIRDTAQPVLISAAPRLDTRGGFAGLVGSSRFVEAAFNAASEAAEPVTVPLNPDFSVKLDRALRAPLGRIIANADSINAQSEGPLRQDYADYAADIAAAGRHLLGLVDDLVDLQAIERADFVAAAEPIDLSDIARRAAGLLAVRATAAHVRIDRPGGDEVLPATGEFRRTLQILVNLIGNAVRYSPLDSMVWIRAERSGNFAAVVVADQGKGIAVQDQARIFEKFERVDTAEPGGSGLGLYIARRLARAMGGDITVDSAPGQGARFILTLPYRDL